MIVEKSFDGATGTEVLLEAHVVVAGAASDVNGLAPAGRVNFKVAWLYAPKTPKKNGAPP